MPCCVDLQDLQNRNVKQWNIATKTRTKCQNDMRNTPNMQSTSWALWSVLILWALTGSDVDVALHAFLSQNGIAEHIWTWFCAGCDHSKSAIWSERSWWDMVSTMVANCKQAKPGSSKGHRMKCHTRQTITCHKGIACTVSPSLLPSPPACTLATEISVPGTRKAPKKLLVRIWTKMPFLWAVFDRNQSGRGAVGASRCLNPRILTTYNLESFLSNPRNLLSNSKIL